MEESRPSVNQNSGADMDEKMLRNCGKEEFSRESKIMEMFISNAGIYTKLSSAALFLTVTFCRQVIGLSNSQPLPRSAILMLCWISFLVAILAGTLYQYHAVKFLEWKSGVYRSHHNLVEWLVQHPWPIYAVLLAAFYLGALFFTIFAVQQVYGGQAGDPPFHR